MSKLSSRLSGKFPGTWLRRLVLPAVVILVALYEIVFGSSGCVEIRPGEVGVTYNNTGVAIFGDRAKSVVDQGVQTFIPALQSFEKLERRPQILIMAEEKTVLSRQKSVDVGKIGLSGSLQMTQRVRPLTVRAIDGSNFYFDVLEIHYQIRPVQAMRVIDTLGPNDAYKEALVSTYARGILRDEFGRYSFLEIADPTTYGSATNDARNRLNDALEPFGIEVIQIVTPKPKFDARVETAIEERQNAEQEIEVQAEKRRKLEQEAGLKVQNIEQAKNAEYQALLADLEAKKKEAENRLIAVKREADKYFIERDTAGQAHLGEKVTRAEANKVAYRKAAEGLVAEINAVGAQGPDVLNNVIAREIFPQLKSISATPILSPAAPIDIRHIEGSRKSGGAQ